MPHAILPACWELRERGHRAATACWHARGDLMPEPSESDRMPMLPVHGARLGRRTALTTVVVVAAVVGTVAAVPHHRARAAGDPLAQTAEAHIYKRDNVFGSCVSRPSASGALRWASDPKVADDICCNNHAYAEYSGYWLHTSFLSENTPAPKEVTFYDVASGRPLFIAPRGRSWDAFIAESRRHGWPSFRDAETVWENVRVLSDGETVSVNATHLGHNLPDAKGNRYCIDIVCVADQPPAIGGRA